MPQPTAPASGLQLLTDFSEVQTKDGGSCGDPPHRPRCTGRSSARTLSCGFSETDPCHMASPRRTRHVASPRRTRPVASPRRTPPEGPVTWLLQEGPVTWLLREGPQHVASPRSPVGGQRGASLGCLGFEAPALMVDAPGSQPRVGSRGAQGGRAGVPRNDADAHQAAAHTSRAA